MIMACLGEVRLGFIIALELVLRNGCTTSRATYLANREICNF
jgi:hypothetical protein